MTTALVKVEGTTYLRRAYTDVYGHKHKAIEVTRRPYRRKTKRSRKRRAPKGRRWFQPKIRMDWGKGMTLRKRRGNALSAHKGSLLAAGRALQALANVTQDQETKIEAQKDAKYFLLEYKEQKMKKK